VPVLQTPHSEATARGAAYLAGLHVGVYKSLDDLKRIESETRIIKPALAAGDREGRRAQWHKAVQTVIGHYTTG
jgi:glycerol kinase